MIHTQTMPLMSAEEELAFVAFIHDLDDRVDSNEPQKSDSSFSLQGSVEDAHVSQKKKRAKAEKEYIKVSQFIKETVKTKLYSPEEKESLLRAKNYLINKIESDQLARQKKVRPLKKEGKKSEISAIKGQHNAQKLRDRKKIKIVELYLRVIDELETKNKLLTDLQKVQDTHKKDCIKVFALFMQLPEKEKQKVYACLPS